MDYSITQFEQDISSVQPRFADIYIVPAIAILAAMKSGEKPLGRWTRRVLFSAGVYMLMRNYMTYKNTLKKISEVKNLASLEQLPEQVITGGGIV
jgi:hypothetical protein